MVLKCIWIIEVNWMGKYGKKNAEKPTFWSFFGQQSRYRKCPVFCFNQFSYFDHNLLISDLILVIQVAG